MTSIHAWFIGCAIVIVIMSLFCGALGIGTFSIGDEIDEPDVWDILTFAGGGFLSLLTFSIDGAPVVLSAFFWLLLFIETWCIVALVRGVS